MVTTINSKEHLEEVIRNDIAQANVDNAVLVAGHFPYVVMNEQITTTDYWPDFTRETFDIACGLIADDTLAVKDAKIAVVMDDINYILPGTSHSLRKTGRYDIFRAASGDDPILPDVFMQTLDKYGLSTDVLIAQDQGKHGRRNSRIMSERGLNPQQEYEREHTCANSYRHFATDYATENSFVSCMIPSPCFKAISSAIQEDNARNLSNTFFLFDRDIQRDMKVSDMYSEGMVQYYEAKLN